MSRLSPYDYAVFSNDVYNDVTGSLPTGWRVYYDSTDLGFSTEDYFARAYVNDELELYVISHRGTVITSVDNLRADIQLYFNIVPTIFLQNAMPFIETIQATMFGLGYGFEGYTGHSLGASHAALSLLKYNGSATVFELPMPSQATSLSNINIYNAAPNLVNTLNSPDLSVNRLYPSLDIGAAATFNLAPSGADYYLYTLQQHSMGNILLQFNPTTGQPKVSSVETNWPGSASYTGYDNFISYAQNPYFLNAVLRSHWNSELWSNSLPVSFTEFEANNMYLLAPAGVPTTGKTIIGDDSGNDFWGGTDYDDNYQGGNGDDIYRLFGGDDVVQDSGGSNSYYLSTPIKGKKSVMDANPQNAKFFVDNSLTSGDAIKVTIFASPIGSRQLQHNNLRGAKNEGAKRELQTASPVYAIINEEIGKAYLAQDGAAGSFDLGETITNITNGNAFSMQNFNWGDFGIMQQTDGDISFGEAIVKTISQLPSSENYYVSSTRTSSNSATILVSNGQTSIVYFTNIYGSSQQVTITPISAGANMFFYPYVIASVPSGSYAFVYAETVSSVNQYYIRVFDSSDNPVCLQQIQRLGVVYTLASNLENFVFASTDITTPAPDGGYQNDDTAPIYLYTMPSTNCQISRKLFTGLPDSGRIPFMLRANDNNFVLITAEGSGNLISSSYGMIYYYDKNLALISRIALANPGGTLYPFIEADISGRGMLAVQYCAGNNSPNCYLSVYDSSGLINQIILYSGNQISGLFQLNQQPSWVNNDLFVLLNTKSFSNDLTFSVNLDLYDATGTYVKTLMSTQQFPFGNFSSTLTTTVTWPSSGSSSGSVFATWLETASGSSDTPVILKTAIIPFSIESTDVILGASSSASDIDCSSSTATSCYAIAQGGDGDVLTAAINQDATLIGSDYGAKTFKLVPSATTRLLTNTNQALQTKDETHGTAENPDPWAAYESEFARNLQDDSDSNLALWGFKIGDNIDLSGLNWHDATITNGENSSWINILGYLPIEVLPLPDSAPYNLSFSRGGTIIPIISGNVTQNSSGLYPSQAPLLHAPQEAVVATLSAGAIAGIVIGGVIGLAAGGYYAYVKMKNWWGGEEADSVSEASVGGVYNVVRKSFAGNNILTTTPPKEAVINPLHAAAAEIASSTADIEVDLTGATSGAGAMPMAHAEVI